MLLLLRWKKLKRLNELALDVLGLFLGPMVMVLGVVGLAVGPWSTEVGSTDRRKKVMSRQDVRMDASRRGKVQSPRWPKGPATPAFHHNATAVRQPHAARCNVAIVATCNLPQQTRKQQSNNVDNMHAK